MANKKYVPIDGRVPTQRVRIFGVRSPSPMVGIFACSTDNISEYMFR